jgi:hypothetical protein
MFALGTMRRFGSLSALLICHLCKCQSDVSVYSAILEFLQPQDVGTCRVIARQVLTPKASSLASLGSHATITSRDAIDEELLT